jgi:hypothetical protein
MQKQRVNNHETNLPVVLTTLLIVIKVLKLGTTIILIEIYQTKMIRMTKIFIIGMKNQKMNINSHSANIIMHTKIDVVTLHVIGLLQKIKK